MPPTQGRERFRSIWCLLAVFCLLAALVLALWRGRGAGLPEIVGRTLTETERAEVVGRNSPLTEYVFLSPNADFPRQGEIDRITIHHMAANLALEDLGGSFADEDRRASSNYAIDSGGRVALYVEESNRAWTSASPANDHRAVTIEVANDQLEGEWHVSEAAYEKLLELCTDICRRNGIRELTYTGDETGSLTTHKMFYADTVCPGPYLEGKLPELAREVSRRLAED